MVDQINQGNHGVSRLASQYKNSTNIITYLRSLLYEADELEQVLQDVLNMRNLDSDNDAILDIIGAIVGQSREFINSTGIAYFGFRGNAQSSSYGSVRDASLGGRFRALGEALTGLRRLSNSEYRLFIRGRIARNFSKGRPEDIISQVAFVLNEPSVTLIEGHLTYSISVGRTLNPNELLILQSENIIPKPAGVALTIVG